MPEHSEELAAAWAALRDGLAVVDPGRDVLRAGGPDAGTFLQGQLSQDVTGLAPGATAWSWLLQPTGKVDALLRVSRLDGETWLLDTDRGWGEQVAARLNRFKLRTKLDLELLGDWKVVGLRGPAAAGGAGAAEAGAGGVAVDASWPGLPGVDLIGPAPLAPPGAVALPPEVWDAARIRAGIPMMGAELTERTIPAETGLIERTVSFTKGCYTGQELVARIDSRGSNVPRVLRGVALDGPAEPGASLLGADGAPAGSLTSVARGPGAGWVALAYVKRGVESGATVRAAGGPDDHEGPRGTVHTLPLTEP